MYNASSSRPRRVSLAYKAFVSDSLSTEQTLRSPAQFLAVQRIMLKRGLLVNGVSRKLAMRPKSGRVFVRDLMYSYMMSARRAFQREFGGYLCVDATRVAGLDLLFVAFWSPRARKAAWGPPQVLRSGRAREGYECSLSYENVSLRVTEVTLFCHLRVTEVTLPDFCASRKSHTWCWGGASPETSVFFSLGGGLRCALAQARACRCKIGLPKRPEQVLREARLRKERPGGPVSEEEKQSWKLKALDFTRKRKAMEADSAEASAKRRKAVKRVERLASYDWLMCVHNSMLCFLGRGLESAVPAEHLEYDADLPDGGTVISSNRLRASDSTPQNHPLVTAAKPRPHM